LKGLKKAARVVMVHIKQFPPQDADKLMNTFARSPDSKHFTFMPGEKALKLDYAKYVQKTLVQTCPMAISVSMNATLTEPGLAAPAPAPAPARSNIMT